VNCPPLLLRLPRVELVTMPVVGRAQSFPATILETSSRPNRYLCHRVQLTATTTTANSNASDRAAKPGDGDNGHDSRKDVAFVLVRGFGCGWLTFGGLTKAAIDFLS
jgi:hypothetical protein